MRTRYAFLSVVALSISAFAQQPLPFPDSAAKWINTVWLVQPFPPPATYIFSSAQSYCADGVDTVINALTYTQLHYCGGAYKGAFRDDAGTVYYVPADSTSEFLLYDFTLQVGETAQNVYFETGGGAMLGNALVAFITNEPSLGNRRALHLETGATWVEGVGAVWGLFSEPWVNISNYELRLECMSHADSILYPAEDFGTGICDFNMNVPGAAPEASFSAAPNPTHGLLQVQGVTDAHAGFELMAADGRQVNIRPVRNGTTVTFDLGSCPPGLYLLRRWSDTGSTVERIVRE